jgi:hypothetical protein
MKITITEKKTKEVEIHSKYWKELSWYYMILDEKSMVVVKDFKAVNDGLGLFPAISFQDFYYEAIAKAEPISEAEFKNAFIRVSLELEKLMN